MKRQRTDTAAGAVNAFADAVAIPIPEHIGKQLNGTGRMQWGIITRSKAAGLWSENDLELAGELAICRQDKVRARVLLEETDADIDSHPTHRLRAITEGEKHIDTLVKREERLTRLLQIHPEATVGKARDQVKKNQAAADARQTMDTASDLIAKPIH